MFELCDLCFAAVGVDGLVNLFTAVFGTGMGQVSLRSSITMIGITRVRHFKILFLTFVLF